MTNLTQLANIAEIIGVMIVIGGLYFAVLQMRQIRRQRRELAAIELFRSFGSPQFSEAFRAVLSRGDIDESIAVVDLRIAVDVLPERIAREYSHVRCSFQSRLREVRRQCGCDTRRSRLIRGTGRQAKCKCR